ncbi:hypothetical protein BASA60_000761 [Batrachochytrium salamandrivorans]|nr:hypothetical protein BASA60_000761 [Batrachochytrium salamandrivorans]
MAATALSITYQTASKRASETFTRPLQFDHIHGCIIQPPLDSYGRQWAQLHDHLWDMKSGHQRPDTTNISAASAAPFENNSILQAAPIKNIFDPHGGYGSLTAEFTSDSKYLVTLGADPIQTICVWSWSELTNDPIAILRVDGEPQRCLRVNPNDPYEFMSNGPHSVQFYIWDKITKEISQHAPVIDEKDFKHVPSEYTHSTFIPSLNQAMSGTVDGNVIVWAEKSLDNLDIKLDKGEKAAITFIKLHDSSINFITCITDKFIVTGGEDGFIKVFDMNFRILFWCEHLAAGQISSITYNATSKLMFDDMAIPELVVSTKHSRILLLHSPLKNSKISAKESMPEKDISDQNMVPGITNILHGQYGQIRGLTAHPDKTIFAVGGDSGYLQIWDYTTKQILISRYFQDTISIAETPIHTQKTNKTAAKHRYYSLANKKPSAHLAAMKISSLAYSATGKALAVGFSNGVLKMLDAQTLQDLPQSFLIKNETYGHHISNVPITRVAFSPDGDHCAASDAAHVICVLRKKSVKIKQGELDSLAESSLREQAEIQDSGVHSGVNSTVEDNEGNKSDAFHRIEWTFIGRQRTHFKEVIALLFPLKESSASSVRLMSISKDRHVTDFDLEGSSVSCGLLINSIRKIEQIYRPEAAILYNCHHDIHPEQFILTFNSGYKLRQFTSSTQLCRKTVLGPTFGGHVNNLCVLPSATGAKYLAFSTTSQVIGVTKLPLDGNPYSTMGIIGHPGEVSNMVCVHNGAFLITAGGSDGVINFWEVNSSALEAQAILCSDKISPYLNLLDPSGQGKQGKAYCEFEDYFYYAQLRSQGEHSMEKRLISNEVDLAQMPSIMQAMGFYPSNQEIDDMINEVKFSKFVHGKGEEVSTLTLLDLIKLFVNHRPACDISLNDMEIALSHAKRLEPGKPLPKGPVVKLNSKQEVSSDGIVSLLQQYGESLSFEDVQKAFYQLLVDKPPYYGKLPRTINAHSFIQDILGLSPVNSNDTANHGVDPNAISEIPPTLA